ncbi:N-acetylmuramidase domain-containing protein [Pararhizobium haloflavum]|uniref:N-acetylmuramidase domain-containing protein n=1 Tax=Pararhizobium haloflavum TaxID=2037914 RepID=UPI000C17E56C|nr:N-acetylmuramidase domain-containing protein [Pararhizobium haloflavum]
MLSDQNRLALNAAARRLNIEAAALAAVVEVESGGRTGANVAGKWEPIIRFEGHYFDRLCRRDKRDAARAAALASPVAGAIVNPPSQAGRWALLARALDLDADAAYQSVSWGIGQVMGSHWHALGYRSVDDLVRTAREGFAGQLDLMVRYIEMAGLHQALSARDWTSFARGYNGPGFQRNGYHLRLERVYARHAGQSPTLRRGDRGKQVQDLQAALAASGTALEDDGIFGPATEAAVRAYQEARGLRADGIAGPRTLDALAESGDAGLGTTRPSRCFGWLADWFSPRRQA